MNPFDNFTEKQLTDFVRQTCSDAAKGECEMMTFVNIRELALERAKELNCERKISWLFKAFFDAVYNPPEDDEEYLPDFFVKGKTGYTVNCARLAEYINFTENLVFTESGADDRGLIFRYRGGVYEPISENGVKGLILSAIKLYRPELLKSSISNEVFFLLSQQALRLDYRILNSDENTVNFRNGNLHLDTFELTPHSPDTFSTVQIDVDWTGKKTPTPAFDGFLNDISSGDNDVKRLLLEYMGACISNVPGCKFKKALFQVGPGNVGKTLLMNLTKNIIGSENTATVNFSSLENDRFATSRLFGKRLAGCSDLSVLPLNDISVFKMLTGGDDISAEFKGKSQFNFTYKGFLWFCTNKMPKFGGDKGQWVFDRMIILPCENVIPPEKRDKELFNKMLDEKEGIIYKALCCFREAVKRGYEFTVPLSADIEKSRLTTDNDHFLRFYAQCCVPRNPALVPSDRYTVTNVYNFYKNWCVTNNEDVPLSRTDFKKRICEIYGKPHGDIVRRTTLGLFYPFTIDIEKAIDLEDAREKQLNRYIYKSYR